MKRLKEALDTLVDRLLFRPEVAKAQTDWRRKLAREAAQKDEDSSNHARGRG